MKKKIIIESVVVFFLTIVFSSTNVSADVYKDPILNRFSWNIDRITNDKMSLNKSTGKNVTIGIVDTGVDFNNILLKDNLLLDNRNDFVSEKNYLKDYSGHGTTVAGLIRQIAPDSILVPYKITDEKNKNISTLNKSIIKAANDGINIINISIGAYKNITLKNDANEILGFEEAIKYATNMGSIVVGAVGNDAYNMDNLYYEKGIYDIPGNFDNLISVSGTNFNNQVSSFSNYGRRVTIAAPAGDKKDKFELNDVIIGLFPSYLESPYVNIGIPNGYTITYGTSLSAAEVTGGLADIFSSFKEKYGRYPSLDEAKDILTASKSTLTDKNSNKTKLLDIEASLDYLSGL